VSSNQSINTIARENTPSYRLYSSIGQIIQDAQLSERDRAAPCVIVFAKVEAWNWETIFYGHYRSIFNHCDIIGLRICRIPWKNAK